MLRLLAVVEQANNGDYFSRYLLADAIGLFTAVKFSFDGGVKTLIELVEQLESWANTMQGDDGCCFFTPEKTD